MIVANSSPKADPVPAGTYAARCFSMVHLGTRTENILGVDKELNKVRIGWELPTELKVFKEENGEQPYSVSKEFTLSMHEKANLRKFLESWRGKGFTDDEAKALDITALLGKPCMLSVIHKTTKQGNTYAEISSVSALPKGMTCPDLINPITEFTFTPFDQETFNKLPDWLKDKIKSSKEYREISEPAHVEDNSKDEDEPPF